MAADFEGTRAGNLEDYNSKEKNRGFGIFFLGLGFYSSVFIQLKHCICYPQTMKESYYFLQLIHFLQLKRSVDLPSAGQ